MKNEAASRLVRTLKSAAWDSYLLAFVFGGWGIMNIIQDQYLVGGFQVVLSLLNALTGTDRRNLAIALEKTAEKRDGLS